MNKILSFAKETITSLTFMFPLAFSIAVCLGDEEIIGILFACTAMFFVPTDKFEKAMPVYGTFIIIGYTYFHHLKDFARTGAFFGSFLICGILLIASSFFYEKLKALFASPAVSGVMLATALTVTVLFTTDYFGIGATGNTVSEMIASYVSLGFHPNWRGVLYGTIVMVIMITLPRKFKKFSKTVSASFIALAATLLLNLALNPADMTTSITEITDGTKRHLLAVLFGEIACVEAENIIYSIPSGIAMFLVSFYAISQNEKAQKNDYIIAGAANAAVGALTYFPLPYGTKKKSFLPGIIAAAITLLMMYFGEDFILRIPLHSCAVVLIVGAWQSMKWGELKKAFSGILPITCFTACLLSCLVVDFVHGILISFVISLIFTAFSGSSKVLKKS